jgi:hypothetical protein
MWKLITRSNISLLISSRLAFLFGALIVLCVAAASDRSGSEEAKSQGHAVTANERSEAPSPPPPTASISEPKKEDEHSQARLLYDLSYSAKCKTLPDPAVIESAGLLEQFKEDEQFATLRDARQKITQAIQQTTSESALIKSKMDGFSRIMSTPKSITILTMNVLEELNETKLQEKKQVEALSDNLTGYCRIKLRIRAGLMR